MAEIKTSSAKTDTAPEPAQPVAIDKAPPKASPGSFIFTGGPPLPLRALVGFSGISLLVGFFLPWFRHAPEAEPASGLTMMLGAPVGGTPAITLVIVPVLGALLAAASFMGFRWTAHAAIAVASLLLGLGLWVLLALFVEHTALGLWVVVGGAFITLLLGAVTLMWTRDKKK